MAKLKRSVLITDVDNTLLDWVAIWHSSFSAMLGELARLSGIPAEGLYDEIREVHQRHGTSEYAFLIDEVAALRDAAGDVPSNEFYLEAIEAFRNARREALTLYPGVMDFLRGVKRSGALVVAYTESKAYYTEYRFRKLGLDEVVDFLYSPRDHDLPDGVKREDLRKYPSSHYKMKNTEHRHTPEGELKPNAAILTDILEEIGADPSQAVYVGDSLMKDIVMAQDVGVLDAYAKYGRAQDTEGYDLLKKVTHWTAADVEREALINKHPPVTPSITLAKRMDELATHVSFGPFNRKVA